MHAAGMAGLRAVWSLPWSRGSFVETLDGSKRHVWF